MHRFWPRFILPLLVAAAPRRVIEVGTGRGEMTRCLLELGRKHGFFLDVIHPASHAGLHDLPAGTSGGHAFHEGTSLAWLAALPAADVVLLHGDPNWHTAYNELTCLTLRAHQAKTTPPLVLIHNVAWPHARRDRYDDPEVIYAGDRQPYAHRGIVPGQSDLADGGVAGAQANALHEGGPCNGVLTAVEDFIAASGAASTARFHRLPFFNGLGILVPAERITGAVGAVLDSFLAPSSLLQSCEELEGDLNTLRADLAACRMLMTQRTDALMRARTVIGELEQELANEQQVTLSVFSSTE